jgi:methyl-accepting chemotaxis protein
MTYSDPNRLDRIEAIVESNSRQLSQLSQTTQFLTSAQLELARSVDIVTRRMDTLTERMDRVEQQVSHLLQLSDPSL